MIQYSKTGEEPRRTAKSYLNQIENGIKVRRKQFEALLDPALIENAAAKEKALRDSVAGNASLVPASGAWDEIAEGPGHLAQHPRAALPSSRARLPSTASSSRTPARWCAPRTSAPSRTRRACRSTRESRLPAVLQNLLGRCADLPGVRGAELAFCLERMREWLGPDDPVVSRVLGNDSPDTLANRLVRQQHARRRVGARGAVRGRPGRDRRQPGPDDPARRRGRPGCAGAPQALRGTRSMARRSAGLRARSPRPASPTTAPASTRTRPSRCASPTAR